MTRRVFLICDCCKSEIDQSKITYGVDWIDPGFNPSFNQYLHNPITEICGHCATKIANYMESLK